MNGTLRVLFAAVIKWAFETHEDSCEKMARTIIGAARDNLISAAELRAAIDWHMQAD